MAEECSSCGRTGMDLTNIKGEKGDPGLDGGSGKETYVAYASDASGSDFSLTPSDSMYIAIDKFTAGVTPIATDFSGLYFRINKPTRDYKAAKYSTAITNANLNDTDYLFSPPETTPPIPVDFVNSAGSTIEIEINWTGKSFVSAYIYHTVKASINGSVFDIKIENPGQDFSARSIIRLIMTSATSASGNVITTVNSNPAQVFNNTNTYVFSSPLIGISITTPVIASIVGMRMNGGGSVDTEIRDIYVTAYNPNKITI